MEDYLKELELLRESIHWKNKEDFKKSIGKSITILESMAKLQNLTLKECLKSVKTS